MTRKSMLLTLVLLASCAQPEPPPVTDPAPVLLDACATPSDTNIRPWPSAPPFCILSFTDQPSKSQVPQASRPGPGLCCQFVLSDHSPLLTALHS